MPIKEPQEAVNGSTACCAQCGRPSEHRCSRCRQTYYCGRDHQKEHWAAHRPLCSPYKVARDDVLGRHLVATRDLPAGAMVLREAPVATGPPSGARSPLCVACYSPLPRDAPSLCPRGCGWPLCNAHCARHARHLPECQHQRNRGRPLDVLGALEAGRPVHRALTILRCLLLRTADPSAYARLRTLEAHCAKRKASGQWERERTHLAQFMLPFFGLKDEFTEEDVLYMAGVLQINTYPVRVRDPPPFVAVYDEASFIEHACVPNTAKVFNESGELLLRTATPVRRGQHLSICYVETSLGTAPRRAQLKEELLECRCHRCLDASELGTNFSALTCSDQSCAGAVLAVYPASEDCVEDPENGGVWCCNACGLGLDATAAAAITDAAAKAAVTLSPSELLDRAQTLRLGPSHYLLLPARVTVVTSIADAPTQRSDADLRSADRKLRELRLLVDTLLPAEVGLRGRLLFAHHMILCEKELRCARSTSISTRELGIRLQEAKNLLEDAVTMLAAHSDTSAEGKLFKRAERLLATFDSFHKSSLPPMRSREVSTNKTVATPVSATAAAS